MSGFRGLVLLGAAGAAVSTLGMRADEQAAPQDPSAQSQLATELYESARYREALGAYEQVAQSGDEGLVARARKGKVRSALRIAEFEMAWHEADLLNQNETADAEARTLLGDALWASGRFDEADAAYMEALDEGGSTRARFGLARSLASRTRLDEALDEAQKASAEAPQDPEIHALVGLIYERLNRFDQAADALERYVMLLPPRTSKEDNQMATLFLSKVRLLRSFKGRVPQEIEGDASRVFRVPFKLVDKKIVLQGRVNRTPVEFVLDTGAERTGVSDITARRAGIGTITSTLTAGVGIPALRRLDMGRA